MSISKTIAVSLICLTMPSVGGMALAQGVHARTVQAGGTTIHLLEAGPADGPAVLLLHGARFTSKTWLDLGTLSERSTVYYYAFRRLRFLEFCAELRQHILGQLNSGLLALGNQIGFEGQILIQGLRTGEEMRSVRQEIASGHANLADALQTGN